MKIKIINPTMLIKILLILLLTLPQVTSWTMTMLRMINTTAGIDPNVRNTTNGFVRGFSKTVLGQEVTVYLGIPYALPPVGPLRFQRPVPIETWEEEIFEADKHPNTCYQEDYKYLPQFDGDVLWKHLSPKSEDCLYLNVWVPRHAKIRHNKNRRQKRKRYTKPMLIWIYGGGYISGTTAMELYNPEHLAIETGAVVATLQYRVGAFGFMYMDPFNHNDTEEGSGNFGLWDQALAMKWLRDNAENFGSSPELITLFGHSAGAASITIHMLSPVMKGTYKRAILQSGTFNAPWSYMEREEALVHTKNLINDCGCNASLLETEPGTVIDCMREVDAKDISMDNWNSYWNILAFPSVPTVDGEILPKSPREMLDEGNYTDLEIIMGNNKDEGTYYLLYDFVDYFDRDGPGILHRKKFLTVLDQIYANFTEYERQHIIHLYTDWDHPNDGRGNLRMISQLVADYYFICPSRYFARKISEQGSRVYYYFFTQKTYSNLMTEWMGVMHGDEIEYVFGHPMNMNIYYSDGERNLSRQIMSNFTLFALQGRPTWEESDWPHYTENAPVFLNISVDNLRMEKGPRSSACRFWNDMIPQMREREEYWRAKEEKTRPRGRGRPKGKEGRAGGRRPWVALVGAAIVVLVGN